MVHLTFKPDTTYGTDRSHTREKNVYCPGHQKIQISSVHPLGYRGSGGERSPVRGGSGRDAYCRELREKDLARARWVPSEGSMGLN